MTDYQCWIGIFIFLVLGFMIGRQMACHEAFKKGKRAMLDKLEKPVGSHGAELKN
jgi:hypothetical protein